MKFHQVMSLTCILCYSFQIVVVVVLKSPTILSLRLSEPVLFDAMKGSLIAIINNLFVQDGSVW